MKLFEILQTLSRPRGCVVQVGAHQGQEVELFSRSGVKRAIFIEPMDQPFNKLRKAVAAHEGYSAIQAVCSSLEGEEVTFYQASQTMASSMLSPGRVLTEHPDITFDAPITMTARTLDSLMAEAATTLPGFSPRDVDVLFIDTQGAELKVLMGAAQVLHHATAIWTEVSYDLYEGGASLEDIQGFLKPFGFRLNDVSLNVHRWGDALFLKR